MSILEEAGVSIKALLRGRALGDDQHVNLSDACAPPISSCALYFGKAELIL